MKVICPCCNETLVVELGQFGIRKWEEEVPSADSWKQGMSEEHINLVERARIGGLLEAMTTACANSRSSQPRSVERFLIAFLKCARPKRIPSFALEVFIDAFPDQRIEFFSANGIGMVTGDGRPRMFVPLHYIAGESVRSATGGTVHRLDMDKSACLNWVKTKMGYVPSGANLFMEEMRRKSFGEFARPVL